MSFPSKFRKGHGALSNPEGRFESRRVEAVDDGWMIETEQELPALQTTVTAEYAKTIISRNDSPDIPFDYSINPYRGCSHGCNYCYARPTHSYLNLSPGLDFETKLFYKANAAELLEKELSKPGYVCKPINLGANTDPYQPLEKQLEITRGILTVLARYRHPATIVTKGALVIRDLDLLKDMARDNLVYVMVSLTTLDNELKRKLEPRTASPQARLRVLRALADASVPAGAMIAPIIPAITDHEMESLLEAAAENGARTAYYTLVRLPYEVKDLFREWLAEHYPQRAQHVMSLIQSLRGGRDNDSNFGSRMSGKGPFAQLLSARFKVACRRLGLNAERDEPLVTHLFQPPETAPSVPNDRKAQDPNTQKYAPQLKLDF